MKKHITYRAFALLILVSAFQYVIYRYCGTPWLSFPVFSSLRQELINGKEGEILYFGDSVIASSDDSDRDRGSIAHFLETEISAKVINLASPGYNTPIYYELTKYFLEGGGKPRVMIYPLNLRGFRPVGLTSSEFVRERFILRHANQPLVFPWLQPLLVFRIVDLRPAASPPSVEAARTLANTPAYTYDLDRAEEAYTSLEKLVALLAHHRAPAIFYTTPVNCAKASSAETQKCEAAVSGNSAALAEAVRSKNLPFLNLSSALKAEDFTVVEHLKEPGRRQVARRVGGFIATLEQSPSP